MPIGSVSFKYTLNNYNIKKTFDTRINVKDELEFLRFGSSYESQALGLSYISSPQINADKNILLIDTANNITRNAKESIEETEFNSDDFFIDYAGFYITDVVTVVDGADVPLYLWHDLTNIQDLNNLEILDSEKNPVNRNLWIYVDETTKLGTPRRGIYTNLSCSLSVEQNRYEIYYVRYKDLGTNRVVEKLLDSKVFYEQASFLSTRTNRAYVITQIGKEYNIKIVFDSLTYSPTPISNSQRFWLKRKKYSKISLEKPGTISPNERWNLKVTPGDFFDRGFKYWVPEYYTQLFSPAFPYRFVKEKEAARINKNLIYVNTHPIANLGISGYYIYITLKEANGAVQRVFTDDPDADTYITKQGFVTDIFYEKDVIESVSSGSGFILLNQDIPEGTKVYVSCRYIEQYYLYEHISVNPSINPGILGKKIILYVIPNASSRSIHHLVVDSNGVILDATETPEYITFEGNATDGTVSTLRDTTLPAFDYFTGYELEILSGINSGQKVAIAGYDKLSRTVVFANQLPIAIEPRSAYRIIKRVDSYTSNGHTYAGWEGAAYTKAYFKIGEAFVVQSLSIPDIGLLDTRILGGGISDKHIESALKLQTEVSWYWDTSNWDGTAYPGMGAIIINLPRYILKELGGEFEREQVEDIVKRHTASGSYVIIKYYDESTEIKQIIPGDKRAFVEWHLVDANYYNIYIGNSPDNLSLYATQPGTRTSMYIENLDNDKNYYVQVASVVGGVERLGSRILGFVPFNYSNTLPPVKYGEGLFMRGSYE